MNRPIARDQHGQFAPGPGNHGSGTHGLSGLAVRQRAQIIADLGGVEILSATDVMLCDTAARLLAKSRRVKNVNDAVRCSNAACRIILNLRQKVEERRQKARPVSTLPSLAELLQQRERVP